MSKPRRKPSLDKLLADNLDLAHWVVARCFPSVQPNTADWDEHHACALEGLLKAATNYNPKHGSFTNFALCCAYRQILQWRLKESRRGLIEISVQTFRKKNLQIVDLPESLCTPDHSEKVDNADSIRALMFRVEAMGSPYKEVFQHEFWGPKLAYYEIKRLSKCYGFESVPEFVEEIVREGREILCDMENAYE